MCMHILFDTIYIKLETANYTVVLLSQHSYTLSSVYHISSLNKMTSEESVGVPGLRLARLIPFHHYLTPLGSPLWVFSHVLTDAPEKNNLCCDLRAG